MATSFEVTSVQTNSVSVINGPLAGLSRTLGMSTLSYPKELGTDDSKKHYVTFLAKEITPQSYNIGTSVVPAFKNAYNDVKNYSLAQLQTQYTNLKNNLSDIVDTAARTAAEADLAKFDAEINNLAAAAGKSIKGVVNGIYESMDIKANRTSMKSYISLYMPDTLNTSYHANFASISMRDELGDLNKISTIGTIAGSGLDAYSKNGTEGLLNAVGSDPATIKYVIDSFGGVFGAGQGVSDAILQAQGYTSNPQLQMIYHGTSFRSFTLNFIFTPKSQEEASAVEKIIYQFKYYAAPSLQTPGKSPNASMFLTPPALFEVRFYYDGNENQHLPRYTDCVLEDITVDYAPNGWAAHTDGAPLQTHLTLSFHEVEIVDKARLTEGYYARAGGLR